MTDILTIISPIIILIGTGYLAVRFEIISAAVMPGLGRLVLYFCLPALIFSTLAKTSIEDAFEPMYLLVYGLGSLSTYCLGFIGLKFFARGTLANASLTGLGISFSNSAFVGYPILLQVFGTLPAGAFSMSLLIENLLMLPLALFVLEFAKALDAGESALQVVKGLMRRIFFQPVMMAILLGLVFSELDLSLPAAIGRSLNLLANAAAGVALFAIGGSLAGKKIRGDGRTIGAITVGKLMIHPAMVAFFVWLLPPFDPTLQTIAVLIASMPMLSVYPVIAANYVASPRYASALVSATLLSFVSISLVLVLLHL